MYTLIIILSKTLSVSAKNLGRVLLNHSRCRSSKSRLQMCSSIEQHYIDYIVLNFIRSNNSVVFFYISFG